MFVFLLISRLYFHLFIYSFKLFF